MDKPNWFKISWFTAGNDRICGLFMQRNFWAGDLYFVSKRREESPGYSLVLSFAEFYWFMTAMMFDLNGYLEWHWMTHIFQRGWKHQWTHFTMFCVWCPFRWSKARNCQSGRRGNGRRTPQGLSIRWILHCSKMGLDQDLLRYIFGDETPIWKLTR